MAKQRSASRVTLDILRVVRDAGPVPVTPLLAKSNMNHVRIKPYLEELAAKGWLEEADAGWQLTGDGREAVGHLERIETALQDFGMAL